MLHIHSSASDCNLCVFLKLQKKNRTFVVVVFFLLKSPAFFLFCYEKCVWVLVVCVWGGGVKVCKVLWHMILILFGPTE